MKISSPKNLDCAETVFFLFFFFWCVCVKKMLMKIPYCFCEEENCQKARKENDVNILMVWFVASLDCTVDFLILCGDLP